MNLFKNVALYNNIFSKQTDILININNHILCFKFNYSYHKGKCYNSIYDIPSKIVEKNLYWYRYGKHHRDNDKPAVMLKECHFWCQYGKLHRNNDLPASIHENGEKEWYQYGKLHRNNDKPAYTNLLGHKDWYKNGKLHRKNNPARIYPCGKEKYYLKGKKYQYYLKGKNMNMKKKITIKIILN